MSFLTTYEIVFASFQEVDKLDRLHFFQKTFLLADTSIKIVLKLSFLTLSNATIQFKEKKLI